MQTVLKASSGFSATDTTARIMPPVSGTFFSSRISRAVRSNTVVFFGDMGDRRDGEPRLLPLGCIRGRSIGSIMTARSSRKACSRSMTALASRVKVLVVSSH
jgi:hypothetical protein